MNSNLIQLKFAHHVNNILSVILKKTENKTQLTEDEEQMLWELWIAKQENNLQTIDNKFKE
jgi:hypothetical protein